VINELRICILGPTNLISDGPGIVLQNLLLEWTKSNDVILIGFNNAKRYDFLVKCERFPIRSWLYPPIKALLPLIRADIVLDTGLTPFTLLAKLSFKRCFALIHGNAYYESILRSDSVRVRIVSYLKQFIITTLASGIITPSNLSKQSLVATYGCGQKIAVVRHGVSPIFFRTRQDKERDSKHFLFIGDLQKMFHLKGILTLIKAMSKLVRDCPEVSLTIVGKCDAAVKKYAEEYSILDRLNIVGLVDQSELPKYYASATALVIPSIFDTYALVANEAMACGTPIVVSDHVGAAAIVEQAQSGLIFKSGNVQSLYNCLWRILIDRDLASKLGSNGRKFALSNLSWDVITSEYLGLFRRALGP
jgi:glycosyltransferase involved in cell wall biosynthesis